MTIEIKVYSLVAVVWNVQLFYCNFFLMHLIHSAFLLFNENLDVSSLARPVIYLTNIHYLSPYVPLYTGRASCSV